MPAARIYQTPKNAMSSGRGRTKCWVLEFVTSERHEADPLMGWAGGGDTREQLRLTFPSAEAAQAYALREGIEAAIVPAPQRRLKLQAYADNFR